MTPGGGGGGVFLLLHAAGRSTLLCAGGTISSVFRLYIMFMKHDEGAAAAATQTLIIMPQWWKYIYKCNFDISVAFFSTSPYLKYHISQEANMMKPVYNIIQHSFHRFCLCVYALCLGV